MAHLTPSQTLNPDMKYTPRLLIFGSAFVAALFLLGYNTCRSVTELEPWGAFSGGRRKTFSGRTFLGSFAAVGEVPSDLSIHMENVYTKKTGPITGYPWEYIAEPYKVTTFSLKGNVPPVSNSLDYRWFVGDHLQATGVSMETLFTTLGSYSVVVEAFAPGAETIVLAKQAITIMVKYVRREIRQLTDQDREAFFNAVGVLQRVPTKVGQRLWGNKYFSKDYMVRIHLYYGGTADCDHWHQGPGFVTSHMAYTLMYEQALQSINPSVTVPFWDFTLESTFYEPSTWRQSPVFSPDWFGAASPDNDLHTVTTGRFAYAPTMASAKEFSAVTNPFGLLRAPWNTDSTPFSTRHRYVYGLDNNMKPSGCAEYSKVLHFSTWMDLAKQLNSAAHGHIHETVGGSWNHFYGAEIGEPTEPAFAFAHQIQMLSKDMWRTGFLTCPDTCTLGEPSTTCKCGCTDESMQGLSPYEVLRQSGVLETAEYFDADKNLISSFVNHTTGETHYQLEGYTIEQSEKIYSEILHYVCDPGHIGDMFQATSSNDITFWVLHPTMDRLWHFKRLANDPAYNETWTYIDDACYGHNPDDMQPFRGLFGETQDDPSGSNLKYYTNKELYALLHPALDELPYVYSDFKWDHCEALGYSMTTEVSIKTSKKSGY